MQQTKNRPISIIESHSTRSPDKASGFSRETSKKIGFLFFDKNATNKKPSNHLGGFL
jgi:hypothetical protein